MRIGTALDRYVFSEFWKIFVGTAFGFPILVVIIDLTDNLDKYLARNLPRADIALSYLYWLPDSMFMILPAAVLFATVFSIGALTRHSEIAAAKASGISFYRFIAPIVVGSLLATIIGLALGEVLPFTNAKRLELLGESQTRRGNDRYNFVYSAERGRVYKINTLNVSRSVVDGVEIERKGRSRDYPTWVLTALKGTHTPERGWTLQSGNMHIIPDDRGDIAFSFDSARSRHMTERPIDLMATPKAPQDMGYRQLGEFIGAMERSGADVNELRVERMLKIAIPVTCMIILLFGAPLATSTQRGGAAYGIGVSLGTTIIFLMMIQLTKAIGGKGIIQPEIAAWTPSAIFAVVGVVLLARVRT